MEEKNLQARAQRLRTAQKQRRRWQGVVSVLAAIVVLVTACWLTLPAVTMTRGTIAVEAEKESAAPGEQISVRVQAEASGGRAETFFVLAAQGENAGMQSEGLSFDEEGIARVNPKEGNPFALHRIYCEDGAVQYWFSLQEGESSVFTLSFVNGVDCYASVESPAETIEPTPSLTPLPTSESLEESESAPYTATPAPVSEETPVDSASATPTLTPSVLETPAPTATQFPQESILPSAAPEDTNTTEAAEVPEPSASSAQEPMLEVVEGGSLPGPSGAGEMPVLGRALPLLRPHAALNLFEQAVSGAEALSSQNPAPTAPTRTEIVRIAAGDAETSGVLTLSLGSGATLEAAQSALQAELSLTWEPSAEEKPVQTPIPDDATSWATVHKEGFAATAGGAIRLFAMDANQGEYAGQGGEPYDFSENITSVTVSRHENNQWVPDTVFTDGDNVRVVIQYKIPENTVGDSNNTIYYELPEGITLSQAESGEVYDGPSSVGRYTISADGFIEIVFNDNYADDRPFTGQIEFEGTLSAQKGLEETEIDFGADVTITVHPSPDPTDVRVDKSGSYNTEDGKLHYIIEVKTTQGTGGPVTVADAFGTGNTSATYEEGSFQVVKVKADGTEEPLTGYMPSITSENWNGAPQRFTLSNLPELDAGESYRITYTATPGETNNANGYSSVDNNATASSNGNSSSDWNQVVISQNMLSKGSNYDAAAGVITWTITINPDKRDIGGYILSDEITANGVTAKLPSTVTLTGSGGSSQTISLPYTFLENSSDTYTITYQTIVEGLDPGETASVTNDAHLSDGNDDYNAESTVWLQGQSLSSTKSYGWHDGGQDSGDIGTYQWNANITVPSSVDSDDLASLIFTDTIHDLVTEDGTEVEGSHYITAQQLDAINLNVNGTTLERGTDYEICDANGAKITDFTGNATYTGFQIHFTEAALEKIAGQTISLQYYTTVDYTLLTDGESYTIRNTGGIPDHETTPETDYDKPGRMEKQASATGAIHEWGGVDTSSFTGEGLSIDFDATGGIIHYRLLLHTTADTTGDITVTDLLPSGASLVEGSAYLRFYYNDNYESESITWWDNEGEHTYNAAEKFNVSSETLDGTTTLTFTVNDGYNNGVTNDQWHILAIYYDVSIAEDPLWVQNPGLEEHLYTNYASWGSNQAETDVTVEREVPELEKTGAQLPQYDENGDPVLDGNGNLVLSDTVQYTVTINAAAQDLVPGLDFITLWDRLTVGSAAGAEFLPGSVHLYRYDPSQENHLGQEIDSSLYAYTYDETQYVLTVNLPDETACVLVYAYAIDRGNAAGDLTISNEAHLTGGTGETGTENDVILKETSSSATVSLRELTLYKVDATNYGKLLPDAVFTLEEYQSTEWKKLAENLTTDANGEFTLYRAENEEFENFNFQDNTLYRLTETQAPGGYTALIGSYYFVWVEQGRTAEEVRQEMIANNKLGDGTVAADRVHFLTTSGALYVPNEPSDLTVRKLWQDENGGAIPPGEEEVQITLFQQAVETNAKTVTITSTGNLDWSTPYTRVANVAAGSNLTIQIHNVGVESLDIQVGSSASVSVKTNTNNRSWTYTINNITEDTTVSITPTDKKVGNSFGEISLSGYTTPSFVPVGEATPYGDPAKLNAQNNWSYTWSSLPKQNGEGQTVYYHVEETTPVPGFEVIYSSNNGDGVQAGELVVINRATGYVLPETGGNGNLPYTAGGLGLLALAGLTYGILRRKGDETS